MKKVPIFELRERMYQYHQWKYTRIESSPLALKLDVNSFGQFPMGFIQWYKFRAYYVFRVELFDPESNLKLMEFFNGGIHTMLYHLKEDLRPTQNWTQARLKDFLVSI